MVGLGISCIVHNSGIVTALEECVIKNLGGENEFLREYVFYELP